MSRMSELHADVQLHKDLFGQPSPPPKSLSSRTLIMMAVLHLKQLAVRMGSMELAALATAVEGANDGDHDEATEALAEAAQLRRMGA